LRCQEASLFFRLVSYRYGRGSMLITTNKGIADWPEVLAGDEVLATAILDLSVLKTHPVRSTSWSEPEGVLRRLRPGVSVVKTTDTGQADDAGGRGGPGLRWTTLR